VTETNRPNLYIVAGPNGAGKSTFARLFLPDYADCRELANFFRIYEAILDSSLVFDGSGDSPRLVAARFGELRFILDATTFDRIRSEVSNERS
jgi:predicted AAA+ superfamily ATPase